MLLDIVSKTCHIYQLSPLWKFGSTRQELRGYSEQVTGLLESLSGTTGRGQGKKQRATSYVGVVSVVKDFDLDGSYCVKVTARFKDSAPGEVHLHV